MKKKKQYHQTVVQEFGELLELILAPVLQLSCLSCVLMWYSVGWKLCTLIGSCCRFLPKMSVNFPLRET